jgi:hypothetical protein
MVHLVITGLSPQFIICDNKNLKTVALKGKFFIGKIRL